MYKYISIACLLLVFIYSCTKSNSGSATPPPPPPPGGTGSGTGISITSVSPLTPYPGDVITVTGTGFDPDMSKDTLILVYADSDGTSFSRMYSQNGTIKILSATTTLIKFSTDSFYRIPASQPQTAAVRVSAPLKSGFTKNILSFKKNVTFGVEAIDPGPNHGCLAIYAGDSIFLSGEGFYPPISVLINGIPTKITTDANSTTFARGFLPLDFFGVTGQFQCTDDKFYAVKVINSDGRTFSNYRYCFQGPNSSLDQPFSLGLSYSLSSTSAAQFDLTGYALRDDYNLTLSSSDNASGTKFTETIVLPVSSGFPNKSSMTIDLTQFPKPTTMLGTQVNYIIHVASTTDNVIGFGTAFTIFP